MTNYINVNQFKGETDSETITIAIKSAKEQGAKGVIIPKINDRTGKPIWIIDTAIRLPSDIEIIIDNAHLRLADGVYSNMFVNEDYDKECARNVSGEQKNITIRGKGNAVLDGGEYNGLGEKNSLTNGLPHISVNTMILFFNVSGVLVEGLNIINQRWWSITNIFVHHSTFRNLSFKADLSRIDNETGIHYVYEMPKHYEEIYLKNADGIDLRIGCHDVVIENITGFTEDDSVALTALGGFERKLGYIVEGLSTDIHDVKIRNIATDPYICSCVRLLNDNGNKLYNIDVEGVTHLRKVQKGDWSETGHVVRIGDMGYADVHSKLGDTYNITVRNVISQGKYAVSVSKGLVDSTIENVMVIGDGKYGVYGVPGSNATLKNCKINNISTLNDTAVDIAWDTFNWVEENK